MDTYQSPRQVREKAGVSEAEMAARLSLPLYALRALEAQHIDYWRVSEVKRYVLELGGIGKVQAVFPTGVVSLSG
jgi:hypothetical protein